MSVVLVTSLNETKANIENCRRSCDKHTWDKSQYWKLQLFLWQAWTRRKPILKIAVFLVTSMNETKANIENCSRSCDKHKRDKSQYWKLQSFLWQAWMRRKPMLLEIEVMLATSMNETKANIAHSRCSCDKHKGDESQYGKQLSFCDKHKWDESQFWKLPPFLWQAERRRKPILQIAVALVITVPVIWLRSGKLSCFLHWNLNFLVFLWTYLAHKNRNNQRINSKFSQYVWNGEN